MDKVHLDRLLYHWGQTADELIESLYNYIEVNNGLTEHEDISYFTLESVCEEIAWQIPEPADTLETRCISTCLEWGPGRWMTLLPSRMIVKIVVQAKRRGHPLWGQVWRFFANNRGGLRVEDVIHSPRPAAAMCDWPAELTAEVTREARRRKLPNWRCILKF
jgi:hypothetical protein